MDTEISKDALLERREIYGRFAIYTGIGALLAGGLLVVAFILTGATGDIVLRSLLTLGLLTAFAFATIGENYRAHGREGLVSVARVVILLVTLGAGLWHIWSPFTLDGLSSNYRVDPVEFITRAYLFILTVGILQLAALGFSLLASQLRRKTITPVFLKVLTVGVFTFAAGALLVTLGFTFPNVFSELELYWRIFVALIVAGLVLTVTPFMTKALNRQEIPAVQENTYAAAPAGFYPEPHNPSIERFWDGHAWRSETRPAGVDDELPPTTEGKID